MEQLIELVSAHPVLYDTSHEHYMRTKLKDGIWEQIANELNLPNGKAAKDQWKKLRDCHRDALKRQGKKKSGQGASVIRPWVYQRQMEFLLPFMSNRPTCSSLSPSLGEVCDFAVDEDNTEFTVVEEQEMNESVIFDTSVEQDNEVVKPVLKKPKNCSVNEMMVKTLDNLGKRAEARDKMRKTLIENTVSDKSDRDNDSLYQFFLSMYSATKNLPLPHQLAVRRKVFEAVSTAEEEVMIANSVTNPSPYISPTIIFQVTDKNNDVTADLVENPTDSV